MKELNNLNIKIYEETLDNGFKIIIIPTNKKGIKVRYATLYGDKVNEFIPIGEKDYKEYPKGIAHFLEHKVFENEKGISTFEYYSSHGADVNANTTKEATTYLFSGPTMFYENLNFLLDFVSKPHFTDENVLKEKGIIIEELKSYLDDPYDNLYNMLMYNTFIKSNYKYVLGGTIESVKSITKEQLYECYNTFYSPSNMFIVITGDVDIDITSSIIKHYTEGPKTEINIKKIKEPKEIYKEKEEMYMPITNNVFGINYKIDINKVDLEERDILSYTTILLESQLGELSKLSEEFLRKAYTLGPLAFYFSIMDGYLVITILGEGNHPEKAVELINKELNKTNISEDMFNLLKKYILSNLIYLTENPDKLNYLICRDYIKYHKINYDVYDNIKNLNKNDFDKFLNNISFEYKTEGYIKTEK